MSVASERRRFPRVKLRLPVRLVPSNDVLPMETETVDISRDGFYCMTDEPFEPGARLHFVLLLPEARPAGASQVRLEGIVEVIRISVERAGRGFGIGCCLREYRLVEKAPEERQAVSEDRSMPVTMANGNARSVASGSRAEASPDFRDEL